MRRSFTLGAAIAAACLGLASAQTKSTVAEPWQALGFLQGTWEAKTSRAPAGVEASGTYIFRKELGGHILARHTTAAGCKGPADFNCDHGDLLYVFQEAAGQPLRAIYFDNEGHVIHYRVSTPAPGRAEFLSEPGPGPQFRLSYELKGGLMEGKFEMRMPGAAAWIPYLEWSGGKR